MNTWVATGWIAIVIMVSVLVIWGALTVWLGWTLWRAWRGHPNNNQRR